MPEENTPVVSTPTPAAPPAPAPEKKPGPPYVEDAQSKQSETRYAKRFPGKKK